MLSTLEEHKAKPEQQTWGTVGHLGQGACLQRPHQLQQPKLHVGYVSITFLLTQKTNVQQNKTNWKTIRKYVTAEGQPRLPGPTKAYLRMSRERHA